MFLLSANEVSGKVMFLRMSVILFTGVCIKGGSAYIGGGELGRSPRTRKAGGKASYWNAFLFNIDFGIYVLDFRVGLYV